MSFRTVLSLLTTVVTLFCPAVYAESVEGASIEKVSELSFDELLNLSIAPISSLSRVPEDKVPASITRITHQDIVNSGARSLDELLEIYVPSFMYLHKTRLGAQIGMRGVISDRNNKIVLLVNGRVMNNRTTVGAVTERFNSLLQDIQSIDVIEGPGSVVHGSGAIAGVIGITTFNASTFDGVDMTVRGGVEEEFGSAEIKAGTTLADDIGIFFYAGVDSYKGADSSDTPVTFSNSFTTGDGAAVVGGEPVPFAVDDAHRSYRDQPRYKLHGELDFGGLTFWARYTRGGEQFESNEKIYSDREIEDAIGQQLGYQQFTVAAEYTHSLTDQLSVDYLLSFDLDDIEVDTTTRDGSIDAYREDEYFKRVLAHYTGFEKHTVSIGAEYAYEEFGKKSPGYPSQPASVAESLTAVNGSDSWHGQSYALLLEDQYQPWESLTTFAGLRVDNTRYTDAEYSPRVGVVYEVTKQDTVLAVFNEATRRPDEREARIERKTNGGRGDVEKIRFYEVQYVRQQTPDLSASLTAYYGDYDVVAFTFDTFRSQEIGTLDYYGLETELHFDPDWGSIAFSHNYAKLLDFEVKENITVQNISAHPYGYGDDLANWPDHISKLLVSIDLCESVALHSSARIFWRFPGGEDLAEYNQAVVNSSNLPSTDGSDKAWSESIFFNLGLTFDATEHLELGAHAYNILGWFDKDYNKRNSFQRTSQYRAEAAALAFSATYSF